MDEISLPRLSATWVYGVKLELRKQNMHRNTRATKLKAWYYSAIRSNVTLAMASSKLTPYISNRGELISALPSC